MNKLDQTPSSRRTPYQKFSDKVFSLTGMPVGRVLVFLIGLLALGWSIHYATREDDQPSLSKSKATKKSDFLAAITLPQNFTESPLPVQIDKLDWMIQRCNQLITQKSEYSDRVQERLAALIGLKAMTLSGNELDPTPTLELFQEQLDQFSSSQEKEQHKYLAVVTYMWVLAENPELDIYTQATAAISAIQEATPVPQSKAVGSFNSAVKYFEKSKDKAKSGKLVQLLGDRLSMAKDREVSEFGFSLIDYPNFFSSYRDSINISKFESTLESDTVRLLEQIEKTPPQSVQTYNVLLNVPEQLLHVGNKEVALEVLQKLSSVTSASGPRIRDSVLPKITRLKTRVDLYKNPFPLSGFDVEGKPIEPTQSEQTLIVFFNPFKKNSTRALNRVANSPLREGSSTTTYLVSVAELSPEKILSINKIGSNFIITDRPTSEGWLEKSGIEQVPYLIRLDKAGVVQRLSFP